uniref:Steroid receptor RNA activator 1-like n=1 Tax=Phallusia mammillata TaxID=59560 RepID=A0A6F9DU63_9ASCI|nr:steroid receptor RNA activator 1-like [Phallusia mammillata]
MQPGGPGWNDPPKLNYQVYSETKTRRNVLNKRVAYLGNETTTAKNTESIGLDASKPPPTCNFLQVADNKEETKTSDKPTVKVDIFTPGSGPAKDMVSPVQNKLPDDLVETTCDDKFDVVTQIQMLVDKLEAASRKEVEKKVSMFVKLKEVNELSDNVANKMKELVFYLSTKQHQKAWDIHVALTCDHFSEVSQWMPGVKRLINTLRDIDSLN